MHEVTGKMRFEDDFDRKPYLGRLSQLQRDAQMWESMFWSALRSAHTDLTDKNEVGLGTGWLVFWKTKDETDGTLDLGDVLGLGGLDGLIRGLLRN